MSIILWDTLEDWVELLEDLIGQDIQQLQTDVSQL